MKYAELATKEIRDIKREEFFIFSGSKVWIRGEYDKSQKKFEVHQFEDVNHFKYVNGNQKVIVGFTF